MNKQQLLLLSAFVLTSQVTSTSIKSPRDLIDQAQALLEELQNTVQGNILAAHDDLQNLGTDFAKYSDGVLKEGQINIELEHGTVLEQVTTIRNLAISAEKDISSCVDIRLIFINLLPTEYIKLMEKCINGKSSEEQAILTDATYIVDVVFNKVRSLESQLNRCGNSILCVEPIVTEVQLDMVRLPQSIKTEVEAAASLLDSVKLFVQQCADTKVTEYTGDANAVLSDLIDCANEILDYGK